MQRNLEQLIDRKSYEVMLHNKEFCDPRQCSQLAPRIDMVNELSTTRSVLMQIGSAKDALKNASVENNMEATMVNTNKGSEEKSHNGNTIRFISPELIEQEIVDLQTAGDRPSALANRSRVHQ